MSRYPRDQAKVHHYPTLESYRTAIALPRLEGSHCASDWAHGPSPEWDLDVGWEGAERLSREGWAEGASRVRALSEKIRDALEPPETLAPAYDVAPFGVDVQLDMGRFVDGDPEHWRINVPRRGGKVTVAVSIGAASLAHADQMLRRGSAGLAIAWVLHDAGYEVDLIGVRVNTNDGGGAPTGATWRIPLEPLLTAYWLAHPASLRRHGFRWLENHHAARTRDSYGFSSAESERAQLPPGAIYLPAIRGDDEMCQWLDDESTIARARRLLAGLDTSTIHS